MEHFGNQKPPPPTCSNCGEEVEWQSGSFQWHGQWQHWPDGTPANEKCAQPKVCLDGKLATVGGIKGQEDCPDCKGTGSTTPKESK